MNISIQGQVPAVFWQNTSTTDETYETVFESQRGFTPTVKVISAPSNTHEKIFPKVWTNSENLVKSTSPELKAKSAVSSIANVEPPSTEPSTAKFFKILEYTQLTVRQISLGSSQNWSIGTDFTHVPACVASEFIQAELHCRGSTTATILANLPQYQAGMLQAGQGFAQTGQGSAQNCSDTIVAELSMYQRGCCAGGGSACHGKEFC